MLYASVYTRVPDSSVSLMHGSIVFCFTLSSKCMTTCPPRSIMPKTGGFSFSIVPRPAWLLRRRRRPLRPLVLTISGCPLWLATTEASSHSTSLESMTSGFFLPCHHVAQLSSDRHHSH